MTPIRIGFSPCPNDTFIFDALINHKINTQGLQFEAVLADVQTLNEWALRGILDFSKISYGVLPNISSRYLLMNSGGALGKGVGPLLISKLPIRQLDEVTDMRIAIPGENTTAHILFSLAFPEAKNKQFTIFSEIENAVLTGAVDAGVIIHENRFTYEQKGLVKILDLGEYWENKTSLPIPLGGIVGKRNIPGEFISNVNRLIRKSVEFAFSNYPSISTYVQAHSQEMSENVMRQHIDLYVNSFTLDLGDDGRKAVKTFLSIYNDLKGSDPVSENVFMS